MKKKVLCAFFLILYLLIACTLLSKKIEREMATQVEILERLPIAGSTSSMTLDPLFYESGVGWLYEVTEGTGWSEGLRSTLVPEERWSYEEFGRFLRFVGGRKYSFVNTASRQPIHGGQVEIIASFISGSDRYLLYCPDGIPEALELPESWSVTARNENTMLLDVPDATFPFFQHRVKLLAGIPKLENSRIISLTEAELFLEALPSAVMVLAALLAGVVFWGFACVLSIHAEENKAAIWFNAALAMASLGIMVFVLNGVDLPASMLPAENIFDWQYYNEELSLIFDALEAFAVTDLLAAKDRLFAQCLDTAQKGSILVLAVLFLETSILCITKWKNQRRRYIGKYLNKQIKVGSDSDTIS